MNLKDMVLLLSLCGNNSSPNPDVNLTGYATEKWVTEGFSPKGTAATAVSQHNTADDSHNDIRLELQAINDRLTAFFDSDNQTLDELSEIVAYITSNKTLIDSITTSKVNVTDIINNLATNVSNKPLSAAQGVALKGLIDAVSNSLANYQPKGNYLTSFTETDPTVPSWAKQASKPSYTASEVGALPASTTIPTKLSQLDNDAGYLKGQLVSANETPVLGSELASASGWTTTGWTGDFASGFTHTSGNTNALSFAIPGIAVGKAYVVEFDCSVDYTNTNLLVTIGTAPAMLLFGIGRTNTKVGVIAVDTGALTFTPESAFVGKISNISIREITAVSTPSQTIKASNGTVISETRNIGESLFVGVGVGGKTVPPGLSSMANVAIGNSATFQDNISGFWNVAVGTDCMNGNVSGSRNVSVGANNLRNNVEGCRNVSIGNFTMAQVKNAHRTVAIGGDCMSTATGSEDNVAIGFQSMYHNTTGKKNVAVGDVAGCNNTTGSYNAFIGTEAGNVNTSGSYNVAVGGRALPANTTGSYNVAIGYTAMYKGTNGAGNVAIGMAALKSVSGATGVKNNVAIGHEALKNAKTVTNTVAIGQGTGASLSTGDWNIIIGRGCDLTDGSTYKLNIGDLLKGSIYPGSAYLLLNGGMRLPSIPTAYSGNSAEVWNNGGVLMVGDGGLDTIVQAVISALPVYNGEVE